MQQVSHHRRRDTPPHLANVITVSKPGKFMCHPVKVPLQVPNLPAHKDIKEAYNTIDNVTETPTAILGQKALDSGQRVLFNDDLIKVQLLCKEDSSFNRQSLNLIHRKTARKDMAEGYNNLSSTVPYNHAYT